MHKRWYQKSAYRWGLGAGLAAVLLSVAVSALLGDARVRVETKHLTIAGQRAFKVVDSMSGDRGTSFTQARYWWYSPKLDRLVTCVAFLEGGGSWQLDSIEKMLNSIPVD